MKQDNNTLFDGKCFFKGLNNNNQVPRKTGVSQAVPFPPFAGLLVNLFLPSDVKKETTYYCVSKKN